MMRREPDIDAIKAKILIKPPSLLPCASITLSYTDSG